MRSCAGFFLLLLFCGSSNGAAQTAGVTLQNPRRSARTGKIDTTTEIRQQSARNTVRNDVESHSEKQKRATDRDSTRHLVLELSIESGLVAGQFFGVNQRVDEGFTSAGIVFDPSSNGPPFTVSR